MCIQNGTYQRTTRNKTYTAYRQWELKLIYRRKGTRKVLVDAKLTGTYMNSSVWLNKRKTAPVVGERDGSNLGLHSLVYLTSVAKRSYYRLWGKVKVSGKTSVFVGSYEQRLCKRCGNIGPVTKPIGYLSRHLEIVELRVPKACIRYKDAPTAKLLTILRRRYKVPVKLS